MVAGNDFIVTKIHQVDGTWQMSIRNISMETWITVKMFCDRQHAEQEFAAVVKALGLSRIRNRVIINYTDDNGNVVCSDTGGTFSDSKYAEMSCRKIEEQYNNCFCTIELVF